MANPVLDRITKQTNGYAQFGAPTRNHINPTYTPEGTVQIPDVIAKLAALFTILLVGGAGGMFMFATNPAMSGVLLVGSVVVTLVLGFVIALKKTVSVPLIVGYAAIEGFLLGIVSTSLNSLYPGVAMSAVFATVSVFAGMLLLYGTGIIKVTSKFRSIVSMMIVGYMIFALINFGFAVFGANSGWGMFALGSGVSILVSLFAVGLASVTLALDFDNVTKAVNSRLPVKYSWLLAHGLIVSLAWLYIEFLRLFANLRAAAE